MKCIVISAFVLYDFYSHLKQWLNNNPQTTILLLTLNSMSATITVGIYKMQFYCMKKLYDRAILNISCSYS